MKVPMLDLSKQYSYIKEDIYAAFDRVMESSQFILGQYVKDIEQQVAEYSHADYGIGVGNGSDALHISLKAVGVGEGDEVITTAFSFFATAGAIARAGAKPVFVDIDPVTFNLDPVKVEAAVTERTKAILPVHIFGQVAEMDALLEIANQHHLSVIEDAAQAIGAVYKGKTAGEFGDTACFSFYPTKNLGAYGDAGMIVTGNEEIAEKCRILRVHGSKPKYHHHILGYNSRLDEMQAAVLTVKFPYLEDWTEKRRQNAAAYTQLFYESRLDQVVTPKEVEHCTHVFHQYTIRVPRRDELKAFLSENGIGSTVFYPVPLHLQPVFKDLGYQPGDLPESEKAAEEVLSLPMFPELQRDQQEYVVSKIRDFYSIKGAAHS